MLVKKLINNPDNVVDEMLAGIVAAHPAHVRLLADSPRSLVAVNTPTAGKVGIVIGGGSGHEPSFLGFVGKGLADGAAIGNVFASPPPEPVLACAKAVDGGAGILFQYGNYSGDVMNFDMAAEMAGMDDLEIRTVLSTDDVATEKVEDRRGVAGNFFIFKAGGAAAAKMMNLDEVERIARKANENTFTMGVALSACSLPHTRKPNFELDEEEIEIGIGIHGEPGIHRTEILEADKVADELLDHIFSNMQPTKGDKVAVLVNSMGGTPLMELYLLNNRVHQRLKDLGVSVHANWVGNYCTALEMAGASITLHRLDGELTEMLGHPCDCAMFRAG